jgi:aspartyl-tRNA(Asn)/glutamyl-tRNA(Gln) amidotransferase subunit C
MTAITSDQVAYVATLARLKLTEQDLKKMSDELTGILGWIDQLAQVNTKDVLPFSDLEERSMPERADAVTDGQCLTEILSNAPEVMHGMFAVPKVIE